jgi:Uma2 family endonuclease
MPYGGSGEIAVPASAQSFDGFRKWALSEDCPEGGRFTYVSGELIIDMSPELYETHNCIKSEISAVIYQRGKVRRLGRFFSDRFLFSNPEAGISTEPDATFVTNQSLKSQRCRISRSEKPGISDELVGSPDWIVEILSKSSVRKDKQLLREGYFRAGVGEYWLVDALGDDIDFQILVPGANDYKAVDPAQGWLASPTFDCNFRLTRERAPDGLWEYTLHIRENA